MRKRKRNVLEADDLMNCPTCERYRDRRVGHLLCYSEANPYDPPRWVRCSSCQGLGKIAPDNRSMNADE